MRLLFIMYLLHPHLFIPFHFNSITGNQDGLRWNQEARGAQGSHRIPSEVLLCLIEWDDPIDEMQPNKRIAEMVE
jgi:hypothetical protein